MRLLLELGGAGRCDDVLEELEEVEREEGGEGDEEDLPEERPAGGEAHIEAALQQSH